MPKDEVDRLRGLLGISQNELARATHTDHGHLIRVLRGERASRPVWTRIRRYFQRRGVLESAPGRPAARRSA